MGRKRRTQLAHDSPFFICCEKSTLFISVIFEAGVIIVAHPYAPTNIKTRIKTITLLINTLLSNCFLFSGFCSSITSFYA